LKGKKKRTEGGKKERNNRTGTVRDVGGQNSQKNDANIKWGTSRKVGAAKKRKTIDKER